MNALLITDNPQDEAILAHALRLAGLKVSISPDIQHILAKWSDNPADFLVTALRGNEPLTSARAIRRTAIVPLIMIVDPVSEDVHVAMIEAGVDWVVERPYNIRFLVAYTQALMRRSNEVAREALPTLQHNVLKLDPGRRTVQTGAGKHQRLSQLEFRLLHTLMVNKGQVLPTDTIVEHVWGYTGEGDRSLVRGLINRLRIKIEDDPNHPKYIRTLARVGYIFGDDSAT